MSDSLLGRWLPGLQRFRAVRIASMPSSLGMLVYRLVTSKVANKESEGIDPCSMITCRKALYRAGRKSPWVRSP